MWSTLGMGRAHLWDLKCKITRIWEMRDGLFSDKYTGILCGALR